MSIKFKKSCMNALNDINSILDTLKKHSDQEFQKDAKLRSKLRKTYNELSIYKDSNPEVNDILAPIGLDIYRNQDRTYWLEKLEESQSQLEYWIHHGNESNSGKSKKI